MNQKNEKKILFSALQTLKEERTGRILSEIEKKEFLSQAPDHSDILATINERKQNHDTSFRAGELNTTGRRR